MKIDTKITVILDEKGKKKIELTLAEAKELHTKLEEIVGKNNYTYWPYYPGIRDWTPPVLTDPLPGYPYWKTTSGYVTFTTTDSTDNGKPEL